jgi:hypothetical protein
MLFGTMVMRKRMDYASVETKPICSGYDVAPAGEDFEPSGYEEVIRITEDGHVRENSGR